VERPDDSPAHLFDILWESLADVLGSAATATLLRRSLRRLEPQAPGLEGLTNTRERFEYGYVVPDAWRQSDGPGLEGLRALVCELTPLLEELTGSVVLRRLKAIPELARCDLFPKEDRA
jgi:hypothetical protein